MPTLDWIGKAAVENHHHKVPYHLLRCDRELSAGDADAGNLLVQGDNLLALKALFPYYAGKVKCIYIDPPYNTGNEGWVYNDNVNSPEIRQWIKATVGKEGEDLSRHDKWLCMMHPRLALLRDFLTQDGAIFISIDDNEVQNLRAVMDELFGARNFVATIIWQKVYSPKNSAKHFSEDHDFIIVYAKNAEGWRPNLVSRTERQDKAYKNRDNDPRGPWKTSDLSARNFYGAGTYPITGPTGRVIAGPPKGMYWRVSRENFLGMDQDNRIWWGKDGNAIPQIKRFLAEVKQGIVPQTLWPYTEVGHTQDAKKELLAVCDFADSQSVFITPKPLRLMKRILEIASDKDSLILDSFAGSGTTGHAVLAQNKADGGSRRFVAVEMDETICRDVTAERIRKAIQGYGDTPGLGVASVSASWALLCSMTPETSPVKCASATWRHMCSSPKPACRFPSASMAERRCWVYIMARRSICCSTACWATSGRRGATC
jgi:adenine-specific DNA-methyltransferase